MRDVAKKLLCVPFCDGFAGVWKSVDFTFADGTVRISSEWPCYGVKVFRLCR
jgi:hypothetical protein